MIGDTFKLPKAAVIKDEKVPDIQMLIGQKKVSCSMR